MTTDIPVATLVESRTSIPGNYRSRRTIFMFVLLVAGSFVFMTPLLWMFPDQP